MKIDLVGFSVRIRTKDVHYVTMTSENHWE